MKEEPLDFKLIEMLNTPICKMDGKDLVYLIKGVLSEQLDNPSVSLRLWLQGNRAVVWL